MGLKSFTSTFLVRQGAELFNGHIAKGPILRGTCHAAMDNFCDFGSPCVHCFLGMRVRPVSG